MEMDEMPEARSGNRLDTGQTLALKNDDEIGAKEKAAEAAHDVTPSLDGTSQSSSQMEPMRVELTTSCMPCKRSPS
jgi:hypothetical protein